MKKKILILLSIIMFLLFVSCYQDYREVKQDENDKDKITDSMNTDESARIIEFIKEHLKANENEDVIAVINTIKPELIDQHYKETLKNAFLNYSLSYKLIDAEILEINENVAKVRIVQETKSKEKSDFKDNRVYAIVNIYNIDNNLKIGESEILNIEYIK